MRISLAGQDLFDATGFAVNDFTRPGGRLRSAGFVVPGQSGHLTSLPWPEERDSIELELAGFIKGSTGSLHALVEGSRAWRALAFEDQAPLYYQVLGSYVDEDRPRGDVTPVRAGFIVSPPCLLGAPLTDASSPVANPGGYTCPGVWTVVAVGPFTLTVGNITANWTGGAGTVVINSETCRTYLGGVEAPQYHSGGYPILLPGNNTVTCTPGFSCTFTPRYA
jgi:hypothetical protein